MSNSSNTGSEIAQHKGKNDDAGTLIEDCEDGTIENFDECNTEDNTGHKEQKPRQDREQSWPKAGDAMRSVAIRARTSRRQRQRDYDDDRCRGDGEQK